MKTVLMMAVASLAIQTSNAAQSTSRVEGVVLESKTDRPMDGATVKLIPEGVMPGSSLLANSGIQTTSTDAQGHFAIAVVPPGRYRVVPERNGYVFAFPPGVKEARDPGVWIQVAAGQPVSDVELKMIQKAVITGRVLDVNGNAAPGNVASVTLMRYSYDETGQWRLGYVPGVSYPGSAGSFVRMNDKGEYRFYDLPSGDYYIRVSGGPRPGLPPKVNLTGYYPGTTDESKAVPIHVEAGDEIQLGTMLFQQADAVEIHLRFKAVEGVLATTRIIAYDDHFLNFSRPSDEAVISLQAGHYDMRITSDGSYASLSLDVGTTKVEREVVMLPGVHVKVHLYTEDDNGKPILFPASFSDFSCRLDSLSSKDTSLCQGQNGEYYAGSGVYRGAPTTSPDTYKLTFPRLPANMYVRSATASGHDVLRENLHVESDMEIDIVLASANALVKGAVRDAGGEKLPDTVVALIPDGSLRSAADLYRSVVSDRNGQFQIQGIAPGSYHLFAWGDLQGAAYRNADFMKKYDGEGIPLKIEKASQLTQDLVVLP